MCVCVSVCVRLCVRLCVCVSACVSVSVVSDSVISRTVARQAPLSMGFFAQVLVWSGSPCPPPGTCPRVAAVNLHSERSGLLRRHLRLRERALGRNAKHVKAVNSTGEGLSRAPVTCPISPSVWQDRKPVPQLHCEWRRRRRRGAEEPREAPSWPRKGSLAEAGRRGHQHLLKARVHRGHAGSQAPEPVCGQAHHVEQLSSQAGRRLHRVALDGHPLLQRLGAKATGD